MRTNVKALVLGLLVAALVIAGSAMARSGSTRGTSFTIRPGDYAVFKIARGVYSCTNYGRHFSCVSGDALPDVDIGPGLRITVQTLDGGHLAVRAKHNPSPDPTDPKMGPYETINYTFTP
jgi:hypothetical protein